MSLPAVKPSIEEFRELAEQGNVVPVYAQLTADFETPLSAYLKIRDGRHAFLFESAESTDASGRWSIVGSGPRRVFEARGKEVRIRDGSEEETISAERDPLAELEKFMSRFQPVAHGNAPPFFGGAVGYLAYDAVRQFEPSIGEPPPDDLELPEAVFLITDTVLLFDHKLRRLLVVANAMLADHDTPEEAYLEAVGRVSSLIEILDRPLHVPALNGLQDTVTPDPVSNTTQEQFEAMVSKAKEYIGA
ncbi:MAG: anthranilate synthase component I, partial [Roseibacillus sp.]|nr:anthranilate synthase component I [Roseibacillus sp.]